MSAPAGEVWPTVGPPRPAAAAPAEPRPKVETRSFPRTSALPGSGGARRREGGSLSLEAVMILPLLALFAAVLLQVAVIISDVLLVHEAARAGARAAATTTGSSPVSTAARAAAPELEDLVVQVTPTVRRDGDLARVEVAVERSVGPASHTLRATAVARVEPAVGTTRREAVP